MKYISKLLYLAVIVACVGIGFKVYKHNIEFQKVNNITLGDEQSGIGEAIYGVPVVFYALDTVETGFPTSITLLGSKDVPEMKSSIIKLTPGKKYVVSFDYVTKGGTNKFNVDLFPDSLPEISLTATTTKQHYDWEVSSNNKDISNCKLRFFDAHKEANEKDIIISNISIKNIEHDINIKKSFIMEVGKKIEKIMPISDKEGYTTLGWYTSKTGGTKVTKDTIVTGDMHLYPRWQEIVASSIKLDKSSLKVVKASVTNLSATILPANTLNKTITWTSSNSKVATVDKNGKVTAVSIGKATITAKTNNNKSATCSIEVINPVAVEKVIINKTFEEMRVNNTIDLKATIVPSNATNKAVTWTSSNSKVATVDKNGKVTAVSVGKAIITAKSNNGKTADCIIEVVIPLTKLEVNYESLALLKGESATLKLTITPSNATNKTITWTSSNSKVATVDKNGKVIAIGNGSAIITAESYKGLTTKTYVNVVDEVLIREILLDKTRLNMTEGNSATLNVTITPNNVKNKAITWTSSNSKVATVDKNGKVTAVTSGKATITAKSSNGITAKCEVTVAPSVITGNLKLVAGGDDYSVGMGYQRSNIDRFQNVSVDSNKFNNLKKEFGLNWFSSDNDTLWPIYQDFFNKWYFYLFKFTPKTVTLTAYRNGVKVAEFKVEIVLGSYSVKLEDTNVSFVKKFGEKIGQLPTKTKSGKLIAYWASRDGETITPESIVTDNMSYIPVLENIVPENLKIPSQYSSPSNMIYDSDTLKYRIVQKTVNSSKNSYAIIWLKDPYKQINSVYNADSSGKSLGGNQSQLVNLIKDINGKGAIAINGSFTWNNSSHVPYIVSRGNIYKNSNYITWRKVDNGYQKLIYHIVGISEGGGLIYYSGGNINDFLDNKGIYVIGNDGEKLSEAGYDDVLEWIKNRKIRNTWAASQYEQSNWSVGQEDKNNRTSICQIDNHNFVLYTGYSNSIGEYMKELHDVFGCQVVVNLDGNDSSAMYYKTKNMSQMTNIFSGSRDISDLLYVTE